MADNAIAIIVAGSGATSDKEVFDLLEDAYPQDRYPEVVLVVPVDKGLYTDSVANAVEWFGSPKEVQGIRTGETSLSRASAKIGDGDTQIVEDFKDILNPEEFKDFDEAVFIIAMPDDLDDPDYDLYADMVQVAIDSGLTVKDLCSGLDDVVLKDPEESAPEPEPEPVKEEPKKRAPRRRKAAAEEPEPKTEDEAAEQIEKDEVQEVKDGIPTPSTDIYHRFSFHPATEVTAPLHEGVRNLLGDTAAILDDVLPGSSREKSLAITHLEEAMFWANAHIARNGAPAGVEEPVKAEEAPSSTKESQTSSRGRGRPRTNFEVKQILDEDGEWIPRPAGRMKKGTEWRTIHADTNEVLEEGTA